MKKCILNVLLFLFLTMMSVPVSLAQDESQEGPQYLTVSTWHWNMDYEDFDMDTWKAVNKEYFDKVTAKNELISGSGVYIHHFTPDSREILFVSVYKSWEDIDKSNERTEELIKEGWPDETARKAYFKKFNAYYSDFHSDEIYATMSGAKPTNIGEGNILYVRKSHFAFPSDGSMEEFKALSKEYDENILMKNENIKGYYPNRHAWGADRTDFVEGYILDSMADLEKMFDRNTELIEEHWPDETARKAWFKKAGRYFTGVHGDYIYDVVKEFVK